MLIAIFVVDNSLTKRKLSTKNNNMKS